MLPCPSGNPSSVATSRRAVPVSAMKPGTTSGHLRSGGSARGPTLDGRCNRLRQLHCRGGGGRWLRDETWSDALCGPSVAPRCHDILPPIGPSTQSLKQPRCQLRKAWHGGRKWAGLPERRDKLSRSRRSGGSNFPAWRPGQSYRPCAKSWPNAPAQSRVIDGALLSIRARSFRSVLHETNRWRHPTPSFRLRRAGGRARGCQAQGLLGFGLPTSTRKRLCPDET